VKVVSAKANSVFFGGGLLFIYGFLNVLGLLASSPQFASLCKTKKQYDEEGPAVCRQSATFQPLK
jgi:hypothetical protein